MSKWKGHYENKDSLADVHLFAIIYLCYQSRQLHEVPRLPDPVGISLFKPRCYLLYSNLFLCQDVIINIASMN